MHSQLVSVAELQSGLSFSAYACLRIRLALGNCFFSQAWGLDHGQLHASVVHLLRAVDLHNTARMIQYIG